MCRRPRERCRRAGIGDEVAFETKVAMAKSMVRRVIADKMTFRWVAADAAYRFPKGWRYELECAAIIDRLTFNGTIIETGTDSFRLASTRARAEEPVKAS
jgi:hypothetical protein